MLGFATVGLLQILSGSWISILQVRRRVLCLLEHIYFAQQGRGQDAIIALSPQAISELWSLVALGPLAVTDLSARSHREFFCVRRVGGVHCFCEDRPMLDLCEGAPAALLSSRHLGKAFDPLAAMAQVARPANSDELPSGVPLVSHPLWLELAEALPFGYI